MANLAGKEIDTTFLSLNRATNVTGTIHRDYIAHCARWSFMERYLRLGGKHRVHHVLDVGCGRETPLPKMLYSRMLTHTTGSYTGVDYGRIDWPETIAKEAPKFRAKFFERADFVKVALPRERYDTIVSFEMLEHVEPYHSYSALRRMRALLHEDGRAVVSTPVYDEKSGAAANHVNEMSFAAFWALLCMAGFEVEHVYGTFASQRDYKDLLSPEWRKLFEILSAYHSAEMLACLFAPAFPEASRNCLWVLKGSVVKVPGKKFTDNLGDASNSNSGRWATDFARVLREARRA